MTVQGCSESYRESGETDISVFFKIQSKLKDHKKVINGKES
jgi:hypothetical protein